MKRVRDDHWKPTDRTDLVEKVRTWARLVKWPWLAISPAETVIGGEQNWAKFLQYANARQIRAAMKAAGLEDDTQDSQESRENAQETASGVKDDSCIVWDRQGRL